MFSVLRRTEPFRKSVHHNATSQKLRLELLEDRRLLSGFADGFEG
jgi:hypothetical protein